MTTETAPMEKDFTFYDDFQEGHRYAPVAFSISQRDRDVFYSAFSIQSMDHDQQNVSESESEKGGRALSPFLLNNFHSIRACLNMPNGVLHAREKIELHAPSYVDDQLEMIIAVKSKLKKNDKLFVVLEQTVSRAKDSALIMTIERTLCWPK